MSLSKRKASQVGAYIALTIIALLILFPIAWLLLNSFKTNRDIYAYPLVYRPEQFTLEHYRDVGSRQIGQYILNSFIISAGSMLGALFIGILPAYAFARYRFKGSSLLLLVILISQMFPMIVFLPPLFKLWRDAGLLNSRIGLIFSYIPFITPLVIIFLRGFFSSLTRELEEAASIDGCRFIQSFFFVVIPTSLPGIAAISIYCFLFSWSELLYSMQILVDRKIQSLPVFLSLFAGEYQTRWGPLFAGSIVAMVPPLVIFLFFQRYLVSGLTAGASKG